MTEEFVFTPKNAYAKDELVACGMGDLFGPGNAKLPIDNMLMLDRITEINSDGGKAGKGLILAELDIHKDLWFFDCHFPGPRDAWLSGSGCDVAARWLFLGLARQPWTRACFGLRRSEVHRANPPSSKLVTYKIEMKRVIERKLVMGIADGSVSVDGREIYTATDLRVGLFQSTDNF